MKLNNRAPSSPLVSPQFLILQIIWVSRTRKKHYPRNVLQACGGRIYIPQNPFIKTHNIKIFFFRFVEFAQSSPQSSFRVFSSPKGMLSPFPPQAAPRLHRRALGGEGCLRDVYTGLSAAGESLLLVTNTPAQRNHSLVVPTLHFHSPLSLGFGGRANTPVSFLSTRVFRLGLLKVRLITADCCIL